MTLNQSIAAAAALIVLTTATRCPAARAPIETRARDPYLGAIVVEAETGEILFEDNADAPGYPASVIKLMTLFEVLGRVDEGSASLSDPVRVTAESARIGGSQVYLAENEIFTIDDLLYALMVQSANDAAVALAIHLAGSKDTFAAAMQDRARAIGMDSTRVHSVHGLPPGQGQEPDVTTARDLAALSRALLQRPDTLLYTSTQERGFRDGKFVMRNHNPLIRSFPGCDGLKTGYYSKAGYSIAATAERHGNRLVCVVLDSSNRLTRDRTAGELLEEGFRELARRRRARHCTPSTAK